jgi:hypothetical protein
MNQRYVEELRALISPTGYVSGVSLEGNGLKDCEWSVGGLEIEIWRGAKRIKCYCAISSATYGGTGYT